MKSQKEWWWVYLPWILGPQSVASFQVSDRLSGGSEVRLLSDGLLWSPWPGESWLLEFLPACLFCEGKEGNREELQRKWDVPSSGPVLLPDQSWSWRAGRTSLTDFCSFTYKGFSNRWFKLSSTCLPCTLSALYTMWSFSVVFNSPLAHLHLLVLWSPIISKLSGGATLCSHNAIYVGHSLDIIVQMMTPSDVQIRFHKWRQVRPLRNKRHTDWKGRSDAVFSPRWHDDVWRKC